MHSGLEMWMPLALSACDPLEEMEKLLQQPNFFELRNLKNFNILASRVGVDVFETFQPGLQQARALSDEIARKSEEWGSTLQEILQHNGAAIGPLSEAGSVVDILEELEMYGGAGPQNLPDEGPIGGADGMKVLAGSITHFTNQKNENTGKVVFPETCELKAEWDELMTTAVVTYSPLEVLEYEMLHHFLVSRKQVVDSSNVTLVTQCSVDRLPYLKNQLMAWNSVCSVAIYINNESEWTKKEQLQKVEEFFQEVDNGPLIYLDIAICFGVENKQWVDVSTGALYPINALRNLAFSQALSHKTSLVLLVDADFVPSEGLAAFINSDSNILEVLMCQQTKNAAIIPSFEILEAATKNNSFKLPRSKTHVLKAWENGEAQGFHTNYYPKGHSPTQYTTWFHATKCYRVKYEENFEPYLVIRKNLVPFYDERFRGYGLNKISHIFNMHAIGVHFYVAPHHFLISQCHKRSWSWEILYGINKDLLQKYRLQNIWQKFKLEVLACEAAKTSLMTQTLCQAALAQQASQVKQPTSEKRDCKHSNNFQVCLNMRSTSTTCIGMKKYSGKAARKSKGFDQGNFNVTLFGVKGSEFIVEQLIF